MTEDIPGDAWILTYAELGELLGIEPESAKRHAVRHWCRRVPGNEGRTLVAVPATVLPERQLVRGTDAALDGATPRDGGAGRGGDVLRDSHGAAPGGEAGRPGDGGHVLSLALAELRTALRTAEERRAEADERAGRAEARAEASRALADRRGDELAEARERAGRAEGESAILREQSKADRERAEALAQELDATRAELAIWTAGGPLARAWRALVYRRGRT